MKLHGHGLFKTGEITSLLRLYYGDLMLKKVEKLRGYVSHVYIVQLKFRIVLAKIWQVIFYSKTN